MACLTFILQVVVTNLGEAAYEAELGIAFPPSLSYVGLGPGSDINAPSLVNRCQSGDFCGEQDL